MQKYHHHEVWKHEWESSEGLLSTRPLSTNLLLLHTQPLYPRYCNSPNASFCFSSMNPGPRSPLEKAKASSLSLLYTCSHYNLHVGFDFVGHCVSKGQPCKIYYMGWIF